MAKKKLKFNGYLPYLVEAKQTPIVFTFGRFNPPTIGHRKLIDAAIGEAKVQNTDVWVFVSQTQDKKKNPLTLAQKVKVLKKMYKGARKVNFGTTANNPFAAAEKIADWGYKNVIMIAGSDRVGEFKRAFKPYVKKDFKFEKFTVKSAGERDADAEGAAGMSASKMRQAAADEDLTSFKKGVDDSIDAEKLFHAVRKGMGLKKINISESKEERHLYKSKAEAERVAKEFGLKGAHAHGDLWMPGPSHQAFMNRMQRQETKTFTSWLDEANYYSAKNSWAPQEEPQRGCDPEKDNEVGTTKRTLKTKKITPGEETMTWKPKSKVPMSETDSKVYMDPPDKEIQEWLKRPKVHREFQTKYGHTWKKEMYETAWRLYAQDDKQSIEEHF